jgi:hypothetical protein
VKKGNKMIKSKKIIINILAVMLIFVGVVGFIPKEKVNASTPTPENYFNYDIETGKSGYGVYITGYKGTDTNITIPKTIEGTDVVSALFSNIANCLSIDFSACTEIVAISTRGKNLKEIILGEGLNKLKTLNCSANFFNQFRP